MNLKSGSIYRLTRDVPNPKPDRRRADRATFARAVLEAGVVLVCRESWGSSGTLMLTPYGRGYWSTGSADNWISASNTPQRLDRAGEKPIGPSLWSLLTADGVLEEVEPTTAEEVLMALDGHNSDPSAAVLEELVTMGKLTLGDVRAGYQAARGKGVV